MKNQLLALSACALLGTTTIAASSPLLTGQAPLGESSAMHSLTIDPAALNSGNVLKAPTRAESDLYMNFGYCASPSNAFPLPAGELKGAIKMTAEDATEFAGAEITSIMMGNPTNQQYRNPIRKATVWISESLDSEPMISTTASLGSKGFEWSSINLEEPYVIEAGKEIYIGYTITIPKGSGIYALVSDGYQPTDDNSAYLYSTFEGFNQQGGLITGTEYKWMAAGDYFGNFCIQARLEGDQLPTNQVAIAQPTIPAAATPNVPFNVTFYAVNIAANAVDDIDVTLEFAGQEPQVQNIKFAKPIYNGEASENTVQFTCTNEGEIDYKLYISKANGEPCNTQYYAAGTLLSINGFSRNVVVEEATGTWCGYCVVGYAGMEHMRDNYGDKGFLGIAMHYNDPMASMNEGGAYYPFLQYVSGYPSSFINRDWDTNVYPSPDRLEKEFKRLIDEPALAGIYAEVLPKSNDGRTVTLNTKTKFALPFDNADYGIAYAVVEDKVGPYPQQNNYAGSGQNAYGFEDLGKVVALTYNDVARNCSHPETFEKSLPSVIKVGDEYEFSVDIELTDVNNLENYRVIAMVIDNKTGFVQNACQAVYNASGVDAISDNASTLVANGSKGCINISCDTPVNVYDAAGRIVAKGIESGIVNVPAGVYVVSSNGHTAKVLVF